MAARIPNFFNNECQNAVLNAKLLVVGAGGIGCELLKNLVLTGFEDIHVIDLDTIDVSNLNRQFLFHKQHVGKSKAVVAKESAQKLNPKANITAYHDSITNLKYNVDFYRQFSAVANALDNLAARKHVNRMCVAADVPLIESGSAGYLGQVTVYKKKLTECYECETRPVPKDFPTCTIRNTPSESIHCVVWAKHLFNQLFGEEDPHQDVSPDPSDQLPTENSDVQSSNDNEKKLSTREKAKQCQYDAHVLFQKLFHDDVKYLLEMKHLWEKRRAPIPLVWEELPDAVAGSSIQKGPSMKDQEMWSIKECANIFKESLDVLRTKLEDAGDGAVLEWDKDDKHCMDFVAACTNIRAYCFGIAQTCRFKVKSMAGNIIPAIATTNAIVGGLIVLQLLKVLKGQFERCRTVILNKYASATRNKLLAPIEPSKPNPSCFVCSTSTPEVQVKMNLSTMLVKTLDEKVLRERLNLVAPDVMLDDGKGTILISSDPEEMEGVTDKTLEQFDIQNGSRLQCDDYFQQFKITVVVLASDDLVDQDFDIMSDVSSLKPQDDEENEVSEKERGDILHADGENKECHFSADGDIAVVEGVPSPYKRKLAEEENGVLFPSKKSRLDDKGGSSNSQDDEIMVLYRT